MSESTDLECANSKSMLIGVHHVGVTAKMQSPLKKVRPRMEMSSESDIFQNVKIKTQYNAFKNDPLTETTVSDHSSPSALYKMRAEPEKLLLGTGKEKPERIEFERYSKRRPRVFVPLRGRARVPQRAKLNKASQAHPMNTGLVNRLMYSLDNMCKCQPQHSHSIIDDLPEPNWNKKEESRHTCIGIYPFEHGCADYLTTTDTHPRINAIVLADRATTYATHFWAELFGLLHIVVAFVVAFILQGYRFVLYSLVNTLIVGLLHLTSDYLLKPVLTTLFNGFLQPPLIFVYNILCSMRDITEPLGDGLGHFLKPLATVCGSIRLIDVNSRLARRLSKDV
ncbi:uncharacterized protein [Drosophila pseudoobscura]|uniref:Uncharacterized protein n=1 Tax=Drosophila pseudoobscura pseudoobscura TaxID=46245 RepID=Q29D98_DROPS|nr:uncharacterized protein LOC4811891 [Drosophila pseudoobscura]